MTERGAQSAFEPRACPFVALAEDRDRRLDMPDPRHRCFAEPDPQPRAEAHQRAYCLSPAFAACPIFLDWAARAAADPVPSRRETPTAAQLARPSDLGPPSRPSDPASRAWAAPPPWADGERTPRPVPPGEQLGAFDEGADEPDPDADLIRAPMPGVAAAETAREPWDRSQTDDAAPASAFGEAADGDDGAFGDDVVADDPEVIDGVAHPVDRPTAADAPMYADGEAPFQEPDATSDAQRRSDRLPPPPPFLADRDRSGSAFERPTVEGPAWAAGAPIASTPGPHAAFDASYPAAPQPPRAPQASGTLHRGTADGFAAQAHPAPVQHHDERPEWVSSARRGARPDPSGAWLGRVPMLLAMIAGAAIIALSLFLVLGSLGQRQTGGVPTERPSSATASPTATPSPSPSPRTYTVQSGDTLEGIAREHGLTIEQMSCANGITDPNVLQVDQVLVIPDDDYVCPGTETLPPLGPGASPTAE